MCVRHPSRKTARVHGFCPRNRSKPRKGPSNLQDARTNKHQRRTSAHRKTRSTEPLHQQAGRKDPAILPAAQKRRKIRMDRGSPQRTRRSKKDPLDTTNLGGAQGTRTPVPLHSGTQQRNQHDARCRTHGRRQSPEHTKANLLPKNAPHKVLATVPALPEARIRHHHDFKESNTLLRRAPLTNILNNPGATGRVAEWNIELSPHDLQFKHPMAIKAQVLPDFLVEWTEAQTPGPPNLSNSWTMFFDGSK